MNNQCKKAGYKYKANAATAIETLKGVNDGRKKPVRFYKCDKCGRYHITSVPIEKWQRNGFKPKLDWSKLIDNK